MSATPTVYQEPLVPHAPPTLARMPSLPALLIGLRRRKLLATLLGLTLPPLMFALVWYCLPAARYMVQAMVHLSSVQEAVLGNNAQDSETRFTNFQKTQMTLVKTQIVMDAVLRDPAVSQLATVRAWADPKDELRDQLKVDFTQGPEILRITMQGNQAKDLVVLVNSVMKHYLEEFVNTEGKRRTERLAQLEKMLAVHKRNLEESRANLATQLVNIAGPIPQGSQIATGKIREAELTNDKLRSLQEEIEKLELRLSEQPFRKASEGQSLVSWTAVEAEVAKDPVLMFIQTKLASLSARETEIRSKYHASFAEQQMQKLGLRDEIASAQRELEERTERLRREISGRLRQQALASLETETTLITNQLNAARRLQARTVAALADLRDVGKESLQSNVLSKQIEAEEKLVAAIENDIRTLQLQELAPARAKPLDQAVVTTLGPNRKLLLIAGGSAFLTLAVLLMGIGLWEFNQRKIGSVDEVIHGFGVPIVATLPQLPRSARRGPSGRLSPIDAAARWGESMDSFRMILSGTSAKPLALLVASADPGEGKSSVAVQLAISFARAGRRTLLIDGDLSKPSLHNMFGMNQGPGLVDVWRDGLPVDAAIQATPQPRLSLLAAGDTLTSPADGPAEQPFPKLFAQLRQQYEVIIVDSAPLLRVAVPLSVAQHVDGVVLSLLCGVTRMPKLSAAVHRLKMLGTPILGAVLNGTSEDVYGTQYFSPAEA